MNNVKKNRDVEYLRLRLLYYEIHEEYERAEKIKQWIIELGGNPVIDNEKNKRNKKN